MRIVSLAALVAVLSVSVVAQTTGVAGSNDLSINGLGAGSTSLFANSAINMGTTSMNFNVSAPVGAVIFGAFAPTGMAGNLPLAQPGHSVDISFVGLTIWLDGTQSFGFPISTIVPASGNYALSVPVAFSGGEPYAFQMAVLSGAFAGGLGVTNAHAGTVLSAVVTSYTQGDDAFVTHAGLNSIPFYGATYNTFNIGSNGQITFGAGSGDFTATTAEFFAGWQIGPTVTPNPGVAVHWTDLNPGGTLSGSTYDVIEDGISGFTTVAFNNQIHWSSNDPAGSFTCSFDTLGGLGTISIDLSAQTPGIASTDQILIGVTDGDDTVGTSSDVSDGLGTGLSTLIGGGGYTSPGAGDSVVEAIPMNTPFGTNIYNFNDLGGGLWFVN